MINSQKPSVMADFLRFGETGGASLSIELNANVGIFTMFVHMFSGLAC